MIYRIYIQGEELYLDEEEKQFFLQNQDKRFIEFKSGELINPAFCSGVFIDVEKTQEENVKRVKLISPKDPKIEEIKKLLFQKDEKSIIELARLLDNSPNSLKNSISEEFLLE